ncbi:MAG: YggN family protein, partial [candidate division Zixibacteria bacterium]|nr:YggN family protein [candidate division Zixibacteria bacterium]
FDFDFDFDDDDHHVIHFGDFHNFKYCNNMDIDIEDGEVYITHSGHRSGTVRITDDYSLYVNGKHIKTNSEQKRLIEEFYNSAEKLQKYAKIIGVKGAEIGIEGAKIGISAIGGLFKLILPGYDTDDYERDIERKSKGIEYKASLLEKEADALEHIAYDMEDIADELKDEIPELQR